MYVLVCGQLSMRPFGYTEIRFASLSASDSMDFSSLLCKFLAEYTMHGIFASTLSFLRAPNMTRRKFPHSVTQGNDRTLRWFM